MALKNNNYFDTMAEAVAYSIQHQTIAYHIEECREYMFVNGRLWVTVLPDGTEQKYKTIC